ncbi:MAG: RNA methyltransferase [Verrucomicrobiales bacterium]|nr:RNA methyltransferase [Verrucomicrobiales bacterium]
MLLITSSGNERLKAARRVRDGTDRTRLFIEGERLAREALEAGLTLEQAFFTEAFAVDHAELTRAAEKATAEQAKLSEATMRSLGDTQHPQGIVLVAQRPQREADHFWQSLPASALLLALDGVQDPGNVGTLIRAAEAAGASAVVLLPGCADAFSPKVLRGAMGSAFRLPLLSLASFDELMDRATAQSLLLTAAAAGGDSHRDFDWLPGQVLVLGNEGRGIPAEHLAHCQRRVSIPLQKPVESLNVASAGAVLLFEAAAQRQAAGQAVS